MEFRLKVYTPSGLVLEEDISDIYLPTEVGEVGILPNHAKYIGILATGVARYTSGGKEMRFVVSGGFCHMTVHAGQQVLMLLADGVDFADRVDRERYDDHRDQLRQIIDSGDMTDPLWDETERKLARIESIDRLIMH